MCAVRRELAPVAEYLSYNGTSGKKNPAFAIWKTAADKRYRDAKSAEKKVRTAERNRKIKEKRELKKKAVAQKLAAKGGAQD